MKIKYTRGKNSNHEDFYLQYNNEVKCFILFHKLTVVTYVHFTSSYDIENASFYFLSLTKTINFYGF